MNVVRLGRGLRDQFNQGDFRGREDSNRWSPGAGAAAGVKAHSRRQPIEAVLHGIFEPGNQVERNDLAAMGMSGELQIEKLFRNNFV